MPHTKDALGFDIPHDEFDAITIDSLNEANKALGVTGIDAANLIATANLNPDATLGASQTDMSQINAGALTTLPAYQQASALADQIYGERESISPAMLSFLFFSKMAEEASKPGATALGAAGTAAATPAAYLMKERELEAADKKSKATLAATLTTALSKTPKSSKTYTINNLSEVNEALGTSLPEGTKTVDLTPTQFSKLPVGAVVGYEKADKPGASKKYTIVDRDAVNSLFDENLPEDTKTIDLNPEQFAALPPGAVVSFTKPDKPDLKTWKNISDEPITLLNGDILKPNESRILIEDDVLPNATRLQEAGTAPSRFDVEKFLSNDYNKQFAVKTYLDLDQQFQKVQTSYEQAYKVDRPQVADVSMIFAYMKMLDPRSVVREGEQAQAQGTGGMLDLAINTYNKLLGGGSLTDLQRKSFRDAAYALLTPAVADLKTFNTQAAARAKKEGVDFDNYKKLPKEYELKFFVTIPSDEDLKTMTSQDLLALLDADNVKSNQALINKINDIVDSRI